MARVLLVDDDEDILDALSPWLSREHEVQTASGVQAALALIEAGPVPDVVITDFDMPPETGERLLTEVASRYPTVLRILHSGTPGAIPAVSQLAHVVLTKGCSPATLVAAVRTCLDGVRG